MEAKITTYSELDDYVGEFVDGEINVMVIVGPGGVGKSKRTKPFIDAGRAHLIEGGQLTAFDLYRKAYEHRNETIVIDDIDHLWKDSQAINLLKLLCQTEDVKTVGWRSAKTSSAPGDYDEDDPEEDDRDDEDDDAALDEDYRRKGRKQRHSIPNSFQTTSRVLVLPNVWKIKDDNLAALMTRGYMCHFDPSGEEVHKEAGKWFTDPVVYDFIGEWAPMVKLNFRDYENARKANVRNKINWRRDLFNTWKIRPELQIAWQLLSDVKSGKLKSKREAEQEFARETGKSRSTLWALWQELENGRNPNAYINESTETHVLDLSHAS